MPKLRIVLAEDHQTVREGLKLIINAQPDMEVVAEAGDGEAAVEYVQDLRPDVVIMDVSMPRMNGLKATERLHDACPDIKILTLTRHADDGYLQQLLRAGSAGYILKQSPAAELLHAIRVVAEGGNYLDSSLARKVISQYGRRPQAPPPRTGGTLTAREEEVLRLIAWGYSNKEIAGSLDLSVKTIETHKANAMQKAGMSSRIDIVRFALLKGWLQDP